MAPNCPDFQTAFDRWPAPALILGADLVVLACNSAYEMVAPVDRKNLLGRQLLEAFPGTGEVQSSLLLGSFNRALRTGQTDQIAELQYAVASPRGGELALRRWTVTNVPLRDDDGAIWGILHCPLEVSGFPSWRETVTSFSPANTGVPQTAVSPLELATILDVERKRLHHMFHQAPGFICVLSGPQHVFELANAAYYQLVGHREIIGHALSEVLPEVVTQGFLAKLDRVYQTGEPFIGKAMPIELQRDAGGPLELRHIDLVYQPIFDTDQYVTGIFVQGNDVSEAHRLSQEVAFQAAHDPLTGLINRREFARLTQTITAPGPHVLLYLDIDNFKIVNDRCGHAAGDGLLQEVTIALSSVVGDSGILARLGGDEFAFVRSNCDVDDAISLADKLRSAVKHVDFIWQGKRYGVTLSVGVASFSEAEGTTFETALGLADAACFLAKESGRDRTKLAVPSDDDIWKQFSDMDNATRLQQAIRDDRIELFGQRIYDLSQSGSEPSGFVEVLARLRDANGALIPPGGFIPAAERFGLIEALDRHIIAKALAHLQGRVGSQRAAQCYFINISAVTLSASGFDDFVANLLAVHPEVRASQICFEVTETAALSDVRRSAAAMRKLADTGIRFALDDFGSGMASFSYLQQLPVHFVKIDGEFVQSLRENPASSIIVESVARLAASMGMQTIAEFVEVSELTGLLQGLGVQYGQGYALHCPEELDSATSPDMPPEHGARSDPGEVS
ncbi:putative bifunctional diguanylate cyclase/phosphodiesterase [Pelagibacterium montanilacus]|uniref:putative bifunctional diguanylate cyclase/phosphodiesterase n=1 Tax=Pelagibacterium montanilacus TaxID=2185280 RepID=UPI000F8E2CDD|nr:EAL domain-containing protein [Pelagibacterium montanilacus]